VVTGASSGIGLELAKQLAAHHYDLVICAEDGDLLDAEAGLRTAGVSVTCVQADLATDRGVDQLWHAVESLGRPVEVLVLNAGIGNGGPFVETRLERDLRVIDLNVRSVIHLAKHVVPAMVLRGEGRVLVTSSIASTQPGTFNSVYNASKSFVQSWALALREELSDTGVTVTSLMPGPTDTDFFARAGMEDTRVGSGAKDDPADVARDGFEALMKGEAKVVSASLKTKLMGKTGRFTPDTVKAAAHGKLAEPGSGS
ncbi:MAG: SDR family NAD(P)-dependent oxidoreductase, partial [Actinomycetes bacterium]